MNEKELSAYTLGVRLGQAITVHQTPTCPFGSDAIISRRCLFRFAEAFERIFGSAETSSGATKFAHTYVKNVLDVGASPDCYAMSPNVAGDVVRHVEALHPLLDELIDLRHSQCVPHFRLGFIVGRAPRHSGHSTTPQFQESDREKLSRLLALCDVSLDALLPEETENEVALDDIEYPDDLPIWRRVEIGLSRLQQTVSDTPQDADSGPPDDVKRTLNQPFDGPFGLRFENFRITREGKEGSGELHNDAEIAFLRALFQAGELLCESDTLNAAITAAEKHSEALPRDRIYNIKKHVSLELKKLGISTKNVRGKGYQLERIARSG